MSAIENHRTCQTAILPPQLFEVHTYSVRKPAELRTFLLADTEVIADRNVASWYTGVHRRMDFRQYRHPQSPRYRRAPQESLPGYRKADGRGRAMEEGLLAHGDLRSYREHDPRTSVCFERRRVSRPLTSVDDFSPRHGSQSRLGYAVRGR